MTVLLGTNLEDARIHNRRVVFETVRLHGPVSRPEIARATALSAQTVVNIVDELVESGLLAHAEKRKGGRGQNPSLLAIEPDAGFTLGLAFDNDVVHAELVNIAGRSVGNLVVPIVDRSPDAVVGVMAKAARKLRARTRRAKDAVWGAGIVLPALFTQTRIVTLGPSPIPLWRDYPLEDLAGRIGCPVFVGNDATAAAIGEKLHGGGRHLETFLYVYIGAGVGGGLILSGRPHRGGSGMAGELGHICVERNGRPCPCGNRGCLERYLSLSSAQAALDGTAEGAGSIQPERLEAALAAGEPAMLAWLGEATDALRQAVNTIENLIDPQTIMLGGSVPGLICERLIAGLDPLLPSLSDKSEHVQPRVMRAALGDHAPALGAAALPLFANLASDPVARLR